MDKFRSFLKCVFLRISVLTLISVMNPGGAASQVKSPQRILVVDIIPKSLSNETNQDSEPFLGVNPVTPSTMIISALTPNPISSSQGAPVFISEDNGQSWFMRTIVPIPTMTADITQSISSRGALYAGALTLTTLPGGDQRSDLEQLFLQDANQNQYMAVQSTHENVDQPFTLVSADKQDDRVLMGENDLGVPDDKTATIEVSQDGGAHYKTTVIEHRKTSGQNGPSVRIATAPDGTIYAIYFGWRQFNQISKVEGWATSDIVIVRDDHSGKTEKPFEDLTGPDNLPGQLIATGRRIHWANSAALGEERIGSTLTIAVDPHNSSRVYVSWADNSSPDGAYTVHLARSDNRGKNWIQTWNPISNATCAALAISSTGVVGFEYQQLANKRWYTHLVQSADDFKTTPQDTVLADVSSNLPNQGWPYLGDYNYLLAIGSEFRGVFSANNEPVKSNFSNGVIYLRNVDWKKGQLLGTRQEAVSASIDPFYFSVPILAVPTNSVTGGQK
jgi:hypothetical protein